MKTHFSFSLVVDGEKGFLSNQERHNHGRDHGGSICSGLLQHVAGLFLNHMHLSTDAQVHVRAHKTVCPLHSPSPSQAAVNASVIFIHNTYVEACMQVVLFLLIGIFHSHMFGVYLGFREQPRKF